jgi:hypothetical protein
MFCPTEKLRVKLKERAMVTEEGRTVVPQSPCDVGRIGSARASVSCAVKSDDVGISREHTRQDTSLEIAISSASALIPAVNMTAQIHSRLVLLMMITGVVKSEDTMSIMSNILLLQLVCTSRAKPYRTQRRLITPSWRQC